MIFRHFTTAEYAALPAELKRTAVFSGVIGLGGRRISREVKLYITDSGREVLAIVSDNPPIVEVSK